MATHDLARYLLAQNGFERFGQRETARFDGTWIVVTSGRYVIEGRLPVLRAHGAEIRDRYDADGILTSWWALADRQMWPRAEFPLWAEITGAAGSFLSRIGKERALDILMRSTLPEARIPLPWPVQLGEVVASAVAGMRVSPSVIRELQEVMK